MPGADGENTTSLAEGQRDLGKDPATGEAITLRRGPYGLYVQQGEGGVDAKGKPTKPRRSSLTKDMDPETLDLDRALKLLSLPRPIGRDPETGEEITAGIGRFGPYIRVGTTYQSLEAGDDVLALGMNRAMELLAKARAKVRPGRHPSEGRRPGRDPQGPLRPLCPARQDRRQPAAQPGHGGSDAGAGGHPAGGEGQGAEAHGQGREGQGEGQAAKAPAKAKPMAPTAEEEPKPARCGRRPLRRRRR